MTTFPAIDTCLIRPMQQEDLAQVLAIDQASFSLPWPESAYRYELNENQNSLLWVAETTPPGGRSTIVGMVVVWLILDEAHIATLAVHPAYRGQGIAKRLLITALRESIRLGMRVATLEVRDGNTAAQELYRRFGFEVVGRRHRYYRDNHEDALIMTVGKLEASLLDGWERSDSALSAE